MVSYPVTCSIWSNGGAEGIVESYSYSPEKRTEKITITFSREDGESVFLRNVGIY
jgi:hypothetical protein